MQNTSSSELTKCKGTLLLSLFMVVLIAIGVLLIVEQQHISKQLASANSERATLLRDLQSLRTSTDQQTAVLNHALGKVIPVVMPTAWEHQLAQLEDRIKDPTRWPQNAVDAQNFLNDTAELFKTLPAWAEADYMPRLTPVRWAAMSFMGLCPTPTEALSLNQQSQELRQLAGAEPDGGSSDLQKRLISQADALSNKYSQVMLETAVARAKAFIAEEHDDLPVSTDADSDIADVYDFLGDHEKDGPQAAEIHTLREELHQHMIKHQAEQQAAILNRQWVAVAALKDTQPEIYQTAVSMLLQQVVVARVALSMEGIQDAGYNKLEDNLKHAVSGMTTHAAAQAEDQQAKAIRDYQRWALEQIKAFESSYHATEEHAKKDASIWKMDNGGWNDARYREVRDAMVIHLMPVNMALLELPVQNRYQRAFDLGWKQLDGREDQTYVAEQTVSVVKKPLRDFMEIKP
ncbi:MAG: hypothetical protein GC164_14080 [Phycisphaera sp.]|nr:hypothetical protein [Phycisphaera sp.]